MESTRGPLGGIFHSSEDFHIRLLKVLRTSLIGTSQQCGGTSLSWHGTYRGVLGLQLHPCLR